jgi:hypothetical protein
MNFLTTVLQTIAFVPTVVNEIEGLLSHRAGTEKKDAAVLFLQEALSMSGAAANRQIVDPEKFQGRNGKSHRRRGRVFECFHLGEGEVGTTSHNRAERYVSRLSDLFAPILQRLLYQGHKLVRNRAVD